MKSDVAPTSAPSPTFTPDQATVNPSDAPSTGKEQPGTSDNAAAAGPVLDLLKERLQHEFFYVELSSASDGAAELGETATKVEPQQVEVAVVTVIPYIYRQVYLHGHGTPGKPAVKLPDQVSPGAWELMLEYCRFHAVRGRSDKERHMYDERFTRMDSSKLCELTSAAHVLEFTPLVELCSKGIARLIRGKSPQQIRDLFNLPDDLSEEEKLEPLPAGWGQLDTRVRLLNNLNAKKRQQLLSSKASTPKAPAAAENGVHKPAAASNSEPAAPKDDRPIEELLNFIEAPKQAESKKSKKSKAAKAQNAKPPQNGAQTSTNSSSNEEKASKNVSNAPINHSVAVAAAAAAAGPSPGPSTFPPPFTLNTAIPQVSLIDSLTAADLEALRANDDDDDDELDPFQQYLLNLALMQQQAPITTLTSLTQFRARNAAARQEEAQEDGAGSLPLEEEESAIEESEVNTALKAVDITSSGGSKPSERDIAASVQAALSRFLAACGLNSSLKVVQTAESDPERLPPDEIVMKVRVPEASGVLELAWKPTA